MDGLISVEGRVLCVHQTVLLNSLHPRVTTLSQIPVYSTIYLHVTQSLNTWGESRDQDKI